jgi:predicted DNA-binding transcriptional regulator YafY
MDTSALFGTRYQNRLMEMDTLLRTPKGLTREQICLKLAAKGLRVSQRNFFRDITALKEMKAPVVNKDRFCEATGRTQPHWFYNRPWIMGSFKLSENDIVALAIAKEVVEKHAGLPLSEDLDRIYHMLTTQHTPAVTFHSSTLVPLSFASDARTIQSSVWKPLLRATTQSLRLKIKYRSAWATCQDPEERLVEPYRIVIMENTWYLLAMDAQRNDHILRQYKILNICGAEATNQQFSIPEDFNLQEILDHAFGRFIGDPGHLINVRIRFKKRISPLITERQFQTNEKKTYIKAEDRIELSLTVASGGRFPYYNILSWILSWGGDAEVMEPADLRKAVADEAKRIAAIYKKTSAKK